MMSDPNAPERTPPTFSCTVRNGLPTMVPDDLGMWVHITEHKKKVAALEQERLDEIEAKHLLAERYAEAEAEVERLRQKLASTEGALDAYARELERLRTERDESIDGIREALTMLNNDDTTGAIRRLFRLQDRYALTKPEGNALESLQRGNYEVRPIEVVDIRPKPEGE